MARSAIVLFLVLAFLGAIKCQSSETLNTLGRTEFKLDNAQTSLFQAMMKQMDNMNHILSGMSNLMEKQNQQLENMSDLLSQQQQSQTQIIGNMASSLQSITER